MASLVSFDSRPVLNEPVFISGLPGVGNIGKMAADLIASQSGAVRFATVLSEDLPPQVMVDAESVARPASCELWHARIGERDVVFLLGEFQGTTPVGQFRLSKDVFDIIIPHDPSLVITLGGYGTGALGPAPRVLAAVTDAALGPAMESAGAGLYPNEPQGGIVGAAAVFLSLANHYGIPAACIMGETSGYIVDHRSSRNVVNVLGNLLGTTFDTSEFQPFIDQIEKACIQASDAQEAGPAEDLSYIR